MREWQKTSESLPADETPVLVVRNGEIHIGELRWDYPHFEDGYEAFRYWDAPNNDGRDWQWPEVTHWMPLPEIPNE